ncbi:MAG TPA: glycosyltransferase family 4 protein [Bacteroidales bacterium]
MNVLITAPSLDTSSNVSGISSVVLNIINHSSADFMHFLVGRKDNEKGGIAWIFKQFALIIKFPGAVKKADIAHINTALNPLSIFRDFFFVLISKIMGKKVLLHLHGGKYLMNDCKNPITVLFINRMIKLSNYVLVLSPLEESRVKEKYHVNRLSYLVNSIPPQKILISRAAKTNDEPLIITFLGRIHESKGVEDIVKAMELVNQSSQNFRFYVYGKGPMKDFMVESLHRILNHRFEYKGVAGGDSKWKALEESDIFLLPSRYGEGLPMAMLEAMAVGNTVITTNDASITYAVDDKINGLIVKKHNPSDIAEKLELLLTNRSLLSGFSQKAMDTINLKFNMKSYIERLEKIYATI